MQKINRIGRLEKYYSNLPLGALEKALDDFQKEDKRLRRKLKEFHKKEEQLQNELDAAEKNLQAIVNALQNCRIAG
jgi:predicted  nucleic acid-binding Zn-ribbon protein